MKPHVLLVEDEPAQAKAMRETFEKLGCQVCLCSNGYEALDVLYSHPKKFFAAFIELNLPVLTGPLLIAKIKELYPWLKSVLVTGQ